MVWIAIALMTAGAVLCVVWPLSKPRRTLALADRDLGFYKHQLSALDREIADGLVPSSEAAGARAEIGRRLLAAADRDVAPVTSTHRRGVLFGLACTVMLFVPAISLGLYLKVGAPGADDMPLASRQVPSGNEDVAAAVARVESHLVTHPEDGRGFEVLAPLYMRFGRFADAVQAYSRALSILGESAARRTGYAQALMLQADGVVTADARAAFQQAATDDPKAPQPQFFLGLAAEQDGDKAAARERWTKLLADAPAGASWAPMVQSKLASLDGAAPVSEPAPMSGTPPTLGAAPSAAPGSQAGAAIAAMPAGQQQQMIRGMVDGLAARLKQSGQDREGWLRLVRAYTVLGDKDKALTALQDARRNLTSDTQGLAQLDELAHQLGLEG